MQESKIYQKENIKYKFYNQKQASMISISLLVAGIGFIFTAGIGFLFSWLFFENSFVGDQLYYLGTPLIIVSFILSIVWQFRIEKASYFFMSFVTIFYCLANGIGFGSIFLALEMEQIMIAFAITGFIFIFTFFASKIMSLKFAISFGKILFISTIGFLIGSLIIVLTSFFWIGNTNNSYFTILAISSVIGGLLSVGYLAYTLWIIQNMDKFINVDNETKRKYSIFFGFMLLMNLIGIIWRVLQLMLIFGRN